MVVSYQTCGLGRSNSLAVVNKIPSWCCGLHSCSKEFRLECTCQTSTAFYAIVSRTLLTFFPQRPTAAVGDFSLGDTSNSDLVLTVSTYSRLSWGNHLARSFQHAVLSSQTLGDLYEALPCPSNEIPFEKSGDGTIFEYSEDEAPPHKGGVVCIEDVAYGDGQSEEDYSESVFVLTVLPPPHKVRDSKLLAHFSEMPPNKKSELRKGPDMHSQRFLDLSLRINEPYWLLHQGSCEHFIVVDQIRSVCLSTNCHVSGIRAHVLTCIFSHWVLPR